MIKRPNKYIYGIIISTALSSSGVLAIENTVKDSKEININKDNNEVSVLAATPLDLESEKQELQKVIDKAQQLYDDAVFGDTEGNYPLEAGSTLIAVRNEVSAVLSKESVTPEEITDAKSKLEDAIATFLATKINISELKAELLKLITEVTQLCNDAQIGFEKGQYPIEAKENLLNAITKAETVYNGPGDTGSTIKKAMEDLNISKEMFLNCEIKEVDITDLIAKITELELFGETVIVGGSPGQYPQDIKDKFDQAISDAQKILGSCTYQEAQDMIDKLNKAKESLENSLIEYDDIIRKELKDQITIAEGLRDSAKVGTKPGEYTQESLNKLYAAIYSAKVTDDNYFATQAEIDNATSAIRNAITDFRNSVIDKEIIDSSELMGLIAQAEQLLIGTAEGDELGEVPVGEKDKLRAVLDSAKLIAGLSSPTQEDINNAAKDLNSAITHFRDQIKKEVDKAKLSDEIGRAIALQTTITDDMIGDEVGMYPYSAKEKFDNAIISAQEIMLSDSVSQSEVDEMFKTLNKAIEDFKKSMIVEVVNKTSLEDAIERAEGVLNEAVVGDKDGMYPKESYDKLSSAIKSAKVTLELPGLTQATLDAKTTELEAEMEAFLKSENIKYKDYRAQLDVKVSEYYELYTSSKEGESVGQYPASVRSKFSKAIEKAKAVLDKNSKVSEDYIKALDELEKAKEEFEKGAISGEDIETYLLQLESLLKQMATKIKDADTSSEINRVPENKKIALSVIYNRLSSLLEETENLSTIKEGIKIGEHAISDFNDRSIYLDNNNVVQGKKLTGKVSSSDTGRQNVNVIDKKEFIPKAGMPIDIKGTLASIGATFVGIGGVMFKKRR